VKIEFYGIYENFASGLNPFKIQARFKLGFISEFYNSKSEEILELGQNLKLFYLK
jgi:hypothetical protein